MSCLVFKCPQCGLLHPASCTDRVIHAFPNKTWRSPGPEIWALTAHHMHPLGFRLAIAAVGSAVVQVVCMQPSLQRVFYRLSHWLVLFIHVCNRWTFQLSLRETTQASLCSAEHQQLQCIYWCTCSTLKVLAHQRAQGIIGTLVDRCSHSSVCLTVLCTLQYLPVYCPSLLLVGGRTIHWAAAQ